ncbi:MAG: type IV secretion system DNA-binding domain-containing protein, partial [Rhodospirillaceae bacterium]|nr:type IV secretion system DNA-binding domain-containing protein [Rhodospirillaceae bacterium]
SLRGLISTWLEIAVNAMLSLAQEPDRRIWVILDELPTLHQVPSLQPGLAESRQFGGCFVLGVQVASALRDLYGRNGAETISGLCGTRVVLAAPDRDTAQWSADSLGRSEVEEISEGYSYGANTIRDGVSLTPRRELRALALPSEIMRLANLEGYLKFPGPFPVASIRLKYVSRPKASERFVPRDGADGNPGSGTEAGAGDTVTMPGCANADIDPPLQPGLFPELEGPCAGGGSKTGGKAGRKPAKSKARAEPVPPDLALFPDEPALPPPPANEPAAATGTPAEDDNGIEAGTVEGSDAETAAPPPEASPKPDEPAVPADKAGGAGTGSEPGDAAGEGAASRKGAARSGWF